MEIGKFENNSARALCVHMSSLAQVEYASDISIGDVFPFSPFLQVFATHAIISLPMLKLVDTSRYFCNTPWLIIDAFGGFFLVANRW